jgi:hypothetical protein
MESSRQGRFVRLGSFIAQVTGRNVEADSLAVTDFSYNRKTKSLRITWARGARYEYGAVPGSVVREMIAVARDPEQSLGRWVVENVRGSNSKPGYPYRRLTA